MKLKTVISMLFGSFIFGYSISLGYISSSLEDKYTSYLIDKSDSASRVKYLNFYGNADLNLCLPFGLDFQFTGGYRYGNFHWKGEVGFDFIKDDCNTCFIPIFKVNNMSFLNEVRKFGIYYSCKEDKNNIISDMCISIEKNAIKNNSIGFGFQIKKNWESVRGFRHKHYIMVFSDYVDLYSFYEQYCIKPKFDIPLINLESIINKLRRKVAYILNNNNIKKLPSYVRIDEKKSTIIFNFAKNYELKR